MSRLLPSCCPVRISREPAAFIPIIGTVTAAFWRGSSPCRRPAPVSRQQANAAAWSP